MFKKFLFFLSLLLIFLSVPAFSQKTKPTKTSTKSAAKTPSKPASTKSSAKETEKEAFEKASAQTDPSAKISALQAFAEKYPSSENKSRALEIIVSSRAQLADEKLRAGDPKAAIVLFKQAVADTPAPISEKLFTEIILQFPANLFYGGQPAGALEVAKLIEAKVNDKANQLLGLAAFYLGTENAAEAKKLAEKAIAIDDKLPAAYQTLGLAERLNFQLEESAAAYAKALEIDSNSVVSKRSLAEMKRALGKSDESIVLYRELIEKDANDGAANNGLILSLFDADKKTEAEELLNKSLEANPNNLSLLVGAAYWYAAHNHGEKAVDFAQKAISIEPRYTWAHIALARGLAAQNRPLEAERSLLLARQYGNFPTLNYEIASARMSAGLFQEAADELKKNFTVKDGVIETKLANRVPKQANNFIELLELERRASIFEPTTADTLENANKVKTLLALNQTLSAPETTEEQLNQAVDEFTKGDDKMKTHRQLYVANRLLKEKKNLSKTIELTQSAVKGVDESLTVTSPSAAILADELYDSRTLAISRGEVIVVPEVPRQTLSAVLRGRIEETAGWALYQQQKPQEAVVRLKRAVSIFPEKSSFWRSSMWRLGSALDASGNTKEALDAYIKSYTSGQPELIKRSVIEVAYRKVNGNLDGLDAIIGARPVSETVAQTETTPSPEILPTPEAVSTPEIKPSPENTPVPETTPSSGIKLIANPTPIVTPTPEATPEITPVSTATPEVSPSVSPVVETTPEIKAETSPTPEASPTAEPTPQKTPEPSPSPAETPAPTPETTPEIKPAPTVVPTVEPKAEIPSPSDTVTAQTEVSKTDKPASEPINRPAEKTISAEKTKSLFEPIVINVPKTETAKPKPSESPAEKRDEPKEAQLSPKKNEEKPAEKSTENKPKSSNETLGVESRPRVIIEDKLAGTRIEEIPSCLTVSQSLISILNNGGNLGILVGYAEEGDISKITAESSSPDDVAVTRDSDVGKQSNRAFFVIKSISTKTGMIPITFTSPCGKKEIRVTVR